MSPPLLTINFHRPLPSEFIVAKSRPSPSASAQLNSTDYSQQPCVLWNVARDISLDLHGRRWANVTSPSTSSGKPTSPPHSTPTRSGATLERGEPWGSSLHTFQLADRSITARSASFGIDRGRRTSSLALLTAMHTTGLSWADDVHPQTGELVGLSDLVAPTGSH